MIEVSEDKPLAQVLVPTVRAILLELDRLQNVSQKVKRALRVLRSFVGSVSVKMGDVELGLGIEPELGAADSGDLEADLSSLLVAVGEAAVDRRVAIAIIADELQYLSEEEFAALIMAVHRVTQRNLPVLLVGAGLPSIRGLAGRAKSYAERLFEFPTIGPLSAVDAASAIEVPAKREGASFNASALVAIQEKTQGYPYFVQEWAYQAWNEAAKSPINAADVRAATKAAVARLDESFFRVRFDRLTNTEKRYLRAMAELGPGPHRSSEIATAYGASPTSVGPLRANLISKGMIYSPAHGDAAFTVPLFDEFMRRTVPYEAPAAVRRKADAKATRKREPDE